MFYESQKFHGLSRIYKFHGLTHKIFGSPKTFFLLTKSFGCQRKELCHFLWDPFFVTHAMVNNLQWNEEIFSSLKTFFLHTKSFGCQRKSFRYRTKENFDTCLRSVGRILTEIWHFSWKPTFRTLCCVNMNWSHGKWHNSVIMSPSDLRQVSKFSLVRYLKLFLWHPKDLGSRKNVLGRPKIFEKVRVFFDHPLQ